MTSKAKQMTRIKWVKAYLECLFEHREVYVFPHEEQQLSLLLW